MGFSILGKPTKSNVINDNSVKALHRTAASLEETDQWVEGIEQAQQVVQARLDAITERVVQGDLQLTKEISILHQRLNDQAQTAKEVGQNMGAAFIQVAADSQDVIRHVLDLEKKIYSTQDNTRELSQYLDEVRELIRRLPPPPAQKSLWYAIGAAGALTVAVIIYTAVGA